MRKIVIALAGAVSVLAAPPAFASSTTTTLAVSATVQKACQFNSTTTVAFGYYTTNVNAYNSTGGFSVTCTNTTAYTVSAGSGSNDSGTQHRMAGTSNPTTQFLTYNLYVDSAHTNLFTGTVAPGVFSGTGTGSAQTYTVYGQIPAGTTIPTPDTYGDTVTLTITY